MRANASTPVPPRSCRFKTPAELVSFEEDVLALQVHLHDAGFDVVKTENLYHFDGEPGFAAMDG